MLFRQRFASFLSLWHSWLYVYRTPILLSVSYLAWKKNAAMHRNTRFLGNMVKLSIMAKREKGSLWTVVLCTNRTHMWFHRAHFMGKIFIWSLNSVPFCHIPVNESIRRLFRKGVKSAKKSAGLQLVEKCLKMGCQWQKWGVGRKAKKLDCFWHNHC